MLNRILTGTLVSAALLSVVVCGFMYWRSFYSGSAAQGDFEIVLMELQQLDNSRSKELLRVDRDPLSDFDRLAGYLTDARILKDKIDESGITGEDSPDYLKNEAFHFLREFDKKEEQIEQYKSAFAIVRNSKRYLPSARSEILYRLRRINSNESELSSLEETIEQVYEKLIGFLDQGDEGKGVRILVSLDELEDALEVMTGGRVNELGEFLNHARVLVKHTPIKNEIFGTLLSDDLPNALHSLTQVYKSYVASDAAQNRRNFLVSFISCLLLILAAMVMLLRNSKNSGGEPLAVEAIHSSSGNGVDNINSRSQFDKMAATLAHEVNTPLGYLKSNVEMLDLVYKKINDSLSSVTLSLPTEDKENATVINDLVESSAYQDVPHIIEDVEKGIGQIQSVVENLKDYTQTDRSPKDWFDINDCVHTVERMTMNELDDNTQLRCNLCISAKMFGSQSEINQILMNLIVNASHAVKEAERSKGVIEVATKSSEKTVSLIVKDNGTGMTEETKQHIFEPFFTTKEPGEGTGLGMAIVQNLVSKHRGVIKILSEEGKGTAIRIAFPLPRAHSIKG